MTSARQQLKEIQERTRRFRYRIQEPQRTGNVSDTENNQEWITYCEVEVQGQRIPVRGEIQKSKSAAEETAAAYALHWLTNHGLI
jgi:hypothetical protein